MFILCTWYLNLRVLRLCTGEVCCKRTRQQQRTIDEKSNHLRLYMKQKKEFNPYTWNYGQLTIWLSRVGHVWSAEPLANVLPLMDLNWLETSFRTPSLDPAVPEVLRSFLDLTSPEGLVLCRIMHDRTCRTYLCQPPCRVKPKCDSLTGRHTRIRAARQPDLPGFKHITWPCCLRGVWNCIPGVFFLQRWVC